MANCTFCGKGPSSKPISKRVSVKCTGCDGKGWRRCNGCTYLLNTNTVAKCCGNCKPAGRLNCGTCKNSGSYEVNKVCPQGAHR